MSRWIAEGATVLVEGAEDDNVVCEIPNPGEWDMGHTADFQAAEEAAHRMAQQIAAEHNAVNDHSEALQAYNYEHDRAERAEAVVKAAREFEESTQFSNGRSTDYQDEYYFDYSARDALREALEQYDKEAQP